jgi:UDP-glucose 4-epimerase
LYAITIIDREDILLPGEGSLLQLLFLDTLYFTTIAEFFKLSQHHNIRGKKILITGGAGFIGSSLAKRLIAENEVVLFDSLARNSLKTKEFKNHKNLRLIQGDIQDAAAVKNAAVGCQIIVHAAAVAGINATIRNPVHTMRVNMVGTLNTLDAAVASGGVERFIDFSTSEVFGPYAFCVGENDSTVIGSVGEARWTYAVSKLAGEHLSHAFFKQYGLPIVLLRPFNVYGPGQVGEGAMQIFVRQALRNENIYIFGDGSQIRAWCFIDDFIDCLTACIENPKAVGEVFNVGNSRAVTTILMLARMIIRELGSSSKILFKEALSADIELRIPKVDKMQNILNLTAKVELEEGIALFANWVKQYEADLPALSPIFRAS